MKLIKQQANYIEQNNISKQYIINSIDNLYQMLYNKKFSKKDESFEDVVKRLYGVNPEILKQINIYLEFYLPWDASSYDSVQKYNNVENSVISEPYYDKQYYEQFERQYSSVYVVSNLYVIVVNDWFEDLKYLSDYAYNYERMSYQFIVDSNFVNILAKFSVFGKFNIYVVEQDIKNIEDVEIIMPDWMKLKDNDYNEESIIENDKKHANENLVFFNIVKASLNAYKSLIENKVQKNMAKAVLPNSVKNVIVLSANKSDWYKLKEEISKSNESKQLKNLFDNIY